MTRPPVSRRVLVVGAGPVGQTAALLLARYGIPVTVLDARPERDPVGSKAICQQRDVLDVWDWCGADRIAQEGLTWSRARTFYRDHDLFVVDVPDPGASPLPPFVNISQARTEQILDEEIAQHPLIQVLWGHEVVDIAQDDEHDLVMVLARTRHGYVRLEGGYAVVCAGARGTTLRTLLDVDFSGRTFDDAFLICDIRAELPGWEDERRFYFDPEWNRGRQVLIHPCPDSLYRIDWQVPPGFDLEAETADGRLHRRITQVIGDQDYELVWTSVYRFHARIASRFHHGRVFLAGDIAHLVAPFGARGLNSGVPDVDNLAWKLAAVLQGLAPELLLASYEPERQAAARENLEVTTATMNFLVPRTPEASRARHDLLERSVDDPEARRQVDSGRLSEAFWYVDSPLTTPDPERPWPGRPERGQNPAPVPGVILPDVPVGGTGRLRGMVRGRLTVLADDAARAEESLAAVRRALPPGVPLSAVDVTRGALDALKEGLDWRPGDLWLVRPDAHTAARVQQVEDLVQAARRVLGLDHPAPEASS